MIAKKQQKFLARKHLEFALSQNWWERHLRGFEAQLPPQLMRNLFKVFKTNLSRELKDTLFNSVDTMKLGGTKRTMTLAADVLNNTIANFLNPPEEEQQDKDSKQLESLEDGNMDLILLLGFDQDIYSEANKFNDRTVLKGRRT